MLLLSNAKEVNLKDACNIGKKTAMAKVKTWKSNKEILEPINWRICKLFYSVFSARSATTPFNKHPITNRSYNKTFAWRLKTDFMALFNQCNIGQLYFFFITLKGLNLHNVWYLGENEIPSSLDVCMCLWLLKNSKHSFVANNFKKRWKEHYCGKFLNENILIS